MKNYLKNSVIYQVFIRNFTKEGDFKSLTKKLEYIKDLGCNIIQLLPICPIGIEGRKGTLGSPYAIKDYNEINEEYGTWNDFKKLINKTHSLDMKIILDIVYNHTSRDSKLLNEHPEWFYKDKDGNFANKLGDWSDVYDLDYSSSQLQTYLINSLEKYLSLGVDGFRFDVGSLIPKSFWSNVKNRLLSKYPNTIMLCESIDYSFNLEARRQGFNGLSDGEFITNGFDLLYEYNSRNYLNKYFETLDPLYFEKYKTVLANEYQALPEGGLRIRGYENHDSLRICELTKNKQLRRNILAYEFFLDGCSFVCNGLETKQSKHISLFDKDLMDTHIDKEWFNFVKKLIAIKRNEENRDISLSSISEEKGLYLAIRNDYKTIHKYSLGLFNFSKKELKIKNPYLLDGKYKDLISDSILEVKDNSLVISEPLILEKID